MSTRPARASRAAAPVPAADPTELRERARRLRCHVVRMLAAAGSGHPGGSLSAADVVACLFFAVMRHRADDPSWPDRDRFVLSKGHACPILYAALAEAGYIHEELLTSFRRFGSPLQGRPDRRRLGLVEVSTGSPGLGLSLGVGLALAARLRGSPARTYVLLGDGECEAGPVWEAALLAAHLGLASLCAVVDSNRAALRPGLSEVADLEPLAARWRAFRWHALEVDGHDPEALLRAFGEAAQTPDRPTVLLARTLKGKGVSFMEGDQAYHGRVPEPELLARALRELEAAP